MNDREPLELAAKAAGMDYLIWTPGASPLVPAERRINGRGHWNPIHDDGDALRLAVKLGINIESYSDTVSADGIHEDRGFDDCAATRRAIVRAAATIGKEM